MPLLLLIGSMSILCTYLINKWFLIKMCKGPKGYGISHIKLIINFTLLIVILHCLFSIYTYTNIEIFPYPKYGWYGSNLPGLPTHPYQEHYIDRFTGL